MSSNEEYFSDLNYTMANEDTSFEVAMVRKLKPKKILSVCGSGGRSLPLLCAGGELLVNSDLAPQQLYLAELRAALYRSCERDDYLKFWGYPPFAESDATQRKKLFLSLPLSGPAKSYLQDVFERSGWNSVLYRGKWERTFAKIAELVASLVGPSREKIFEFSNVEAQRNWFLKKFPKLRWTAVLLFVGNASFFNRLLYKGNFVQKNLPISHYAHYRDAYQRIFTRTLARENYFAQMSFLGRVRYPEGVPIEAEPTVFAGVRAALEKAELRYIQESIVDYSARGTEQFDFLSYSDVPSYFAGDTERNFMQSARASLAAGAHVVLRHYLRVPEKMNLDGFDDVTSEWQAQIDIEKTQMYVIQVFRHRGRGQK